MKFKCIDCKKEVYRESKRCRPCWIKYWSIKQKGKENTCWRNGLTIIQCIDCGKKIRGDGGNKKRCKSCYTKTVKGKGNPNWRGGNPKCIICDKTLSERKYTKCKSCGKVGKKKPKGYGVKIGEILKLYWKDKKRIMPRGKEHWNWKGGAESLYLAVKQSIEYQEWRKEVFGKDKYTCQECNIKGGYLEAHHKIPFAILVNEFCQQYNQFSRIEDKEILTKIAITHRPFWNIDNGQTLCEDCHNKTKTFRGKGVRK